MMMFTDCPPQFSLSGLGCKPSPSAFPGGLSLDELRPPSNHHPAPLSAWPHIKFPASPPFLLELGLQETPFATAFPLSWEFPCTQQLSPLILKNFWKTVAGLRFRSKEAELQLSTTHLRRIHSFTFCITIALMKEAVLVLLNLMIFSNSHKNPIIK